MKSLDIETHTRLREHQDLLNWILYEVTFDDAKEESFIDSLSKDYPWLEEDYLLRLYRFRLHKEAFSELHVWMKQNHGDDFYRKEEMSFLLMEIERMTDRFFKTMSFFDQLKK